MGAELHINDNGTTFRGTIVDETGAAVDVSTAITLQMIFTPPVGTKLTKTASLNTDGKDGKIKYVTGGTDLSVAGEWKVEAYVVFADGSWYHSVIRKFTVKENL